MISKNQVGDNFAMRWCSGTYSSCTSLEDVESGMRERKMMNRYNSQTYDNSSSRCNKTKKTIQISKVTSQRNVLHKRLISASW